MLVEARRHNVNLAHCAIRGHLKGTQLVDFPVLSDLPEHQVSLLTDREECPCIWQVLDDLNFLSVHCKSTVKLVQLSHVEEQDRTLAQAEQDELFLLVRIRKGLLECLFVHPDVEHLRV